MRWWKRTAGSAHAERGSTALGPPPTVTAYPLPHDDEALRFSVALALHAQEVRAA